MGWFPPKQFNSGSPREDWEIKMFQDLNESLTDTIYTIKQTGGSRIVQKSVYIQHLISEEKLRRLKHVRKDTDTSLPMQEVQGEDEE